MDDQPTDLHVRRQAHATGHSRARGLSDGLLGEMTAAIAVLLIGVVVLIVDGNEISWLIGVIAGAAAGAWVAMRHGGGRSRRPSVIPDSPEQSTASAVASMEPAGWRFLHGVRGLDTTFDHIAIGHGGVIVLQSLRADGVITMRGGEPVVEERPGANGPPRCRRLRPHATSDAAAFRADVERVTGRRLWAQAVVVIWSEFPAGCITDGRCVYIHGPRLAGWLARRPRQLDPAETEGIAAAVSALIECDGELPLAA